MNAHRSATRAAFNRRQAADRAAQQAWFDQAGAQMRLSEAGNRWIEALDETNRAWSLLQAVREINEPKIDVLRDQQDRADMRKSRASLKANRAFEQRDKRRTKRYAETAEKNRDEIRRLGEECRRYIAEINSAASAYTEALEASVRAKTVVDELTPASRQANACYKQAVAAFEKAKIDYDLALAGLGELDVTGATQSVAAD